MVSAENTVAAPTPAFVPVVIPAPVPAPRLFDDVPPPCTNSAAWSLTLDHVSVNSVNVKTLSDLLTLGKHRDTANRDSQPHSRFDAAFPGDSLIHHDAAYFKALLAAQKELRLELRSKIKALQALRHRNSSLEKKRLRKHLAAYNAARATVATTKPSTIQIDTQVKPMATKPKAPTDSVQNSFIGGGMISTGTPLTDLGDDSTIAHGSDDHGWHTMHEHISVCSSPSSTGMPVMGKGIDLKNNRPENTKVELEVSSRF